MGAHNEQSKLAQGEFPASWRGQYVPGVGYLEAHGPTKPTDNATGYAPGCTFKCTGGNSVSTVFFVNIGTAAACNFDALA